MPPTFAFMGSSGGWLSEPRLQRARRAASVTAVTEAGDEHARGTRGAAGPAVSSPFAPPTDTTMDSPATTRSFPATDLDSDEMYLLLRDSVMPRPIAWVSTVDRDGRTNVAPYSFFNVCSPDPPVLGFSVGGAGEDARGQQRPKDTLVNIRATGEMVVNIAPESLMEPMVRTSAALPPEHSEFDFAELQSAPSVRVRPPRVVGVPVAFECVTHGIVEIGSNWWVMGRVVQVHVDERAWLGDFKGRRFRVDLLRDTSMRPVGRLGRALYSRLRDIVTVMRSDGTND